MLACVGLCDFVALRLRHIVTVGSFRHILIVYYVMVVIKSIVLIINIPQPEKFRYGEKIFVTDCWAGIVVEAGRPVEVGKPGVQVVGGSCAKRRGYGPGGDGENVGIEGGPLAVVSRALQ